MTDADRDREQRTSDPGAEVHVHERQVHFRGRIIDLATERLELPSGLEQSIELIEHDGAVAIAALDDQGRLVCVEQYRRAAGAPLVEVPAGRLDPGEDPEAGARRELEEETGLRARSWEKLSEFLPAPGFCTERIHLFLATDLVAAGDDRLSPDDDEELATLRLTPRELLDLPCRDAKSIIAASLTLLRR